MKLGLAVMTGKRASTEQNLTKQGAAIVGNSGLVYELMKCWVAD